MELLGVPGFRRTHLLEFPNLWMTCLALSPLGNQRAASCFGNDAEMFEINLSKSFRNMAFSSKLLVNHHPTLRCNLLSTILPVIANRSVRQGSVLQIVYRQIIQRYRAMTVSPLAHQGFFAGRHRPTTADTPQFVHQLCGLAFVQLCLLANLDRVPGTDAQALAGINQSTVRSSRTLPLCAILLLHADTAADSLDNPSRHPT